MVVVKDGLDNDVLVEAPNQFSRVTVGYGLISDRAVEESGFPARCKPAGSGSFRSLLLPGLNNTFFWLTYIA